MSKTIERYEQKNILTIKKKKSIRISKLLFFTILFPNLSF